MVKVHTPFKDLVCPVCHNVVRQICSETDDNGEMAIHIRTIHPDTNLYSVSKMLYKKMRLEEPDNLEHNSTPAHIQYLCQYLTTREGIRKLRIQVKDRKRYIV